MSLPWGIPGGQQVTRSVHRLGGSEGGPVVVRGEGELESENFVTGVSGWQFDAQGNLEANNGNFRGDISGASGTFSGELKSGTDPNSFTTSGGAIWSGAAAFGSAPFRVTPTGFVYAEGYYLLNGTVQQGTMTIASGIASNIDIGGAATIIPTGQLASDNFVSGTAGWAIDGDGDAEFNNVTLRGSLTTADSGRAISVGASNAAFIDLTSGDGDEIDTGYLNVDIDNTGASDFAFINLVSPAMTAGDRSYIDIRHYDNGDRFITFFADQTLVTGGTLAVNGQASFLDDVIVAATKHVFLPPGTAPSPTVSFTADQNTGIFSPSGDQLGFSTGGILRFSLTNTAMFAPGMATKTAAGLTVERFGSLGNEIYAETSTGALKANQRPAEDLVPKLLQLQPTMWDAMSRDSEGNVTTTDDERPERNRGTTFDRPGLIVEDVAEVWPELVIFDDDGEPVGLDRMQLITGLVQAVQQLWNR